MGTPRSRGDLSHHHMRAAHGADHGCHVRLRSPMEQARAGAGPEEAVHPEMERSQDGEEGKRGDGNQGVRGTVGNGSGVIVGV